jgi:hypothetical protein
MFDESTKCKLPFAPDALPNLIYGIPVKCDCGATVYPEKSGDEWVKSHHNRPRGSV